MSESPATRSSTRQAGAGVQKIATWSEISCPSWKSLGQWMKKWPFWLPANWTPAFSSAFACLPG